jgi:hypothetical protein
MKDMQFCPNHASPVRGVHQVILHSTHAPDLIVATCRPEHAEMIADALNESIDESFERGTAEEQAALDRMLKEIFGRPPSGLGTKRPHPYIPMETAHGERCGFEAAGGPPFCPGSPMDHPFGSSQAGGASALVEYARSRPDFPKVVCVCGSSRFKVSIETARRNLTELGIIVLGPELFGNEGNDPAKEHLPRISEERKRALDNLHLRKVELADCLLVVNPNGYVGESTKNEMIHGVGLGKELWFSHHPSAETLSLLASLKRPQGGSSMVGAIALALGITDDRGVKAAIRGEKI